MDLGLAVWDQRFFACAVARLIDSLDKQIGFLVRALLMEAPAVLLRKQGGLVNCANRFVAVGPAAPDHEELLQNLTRDPPDRVDHARYFPSESWTRSSMRMLTFGS